MSCGQLAELELMRQVIHAYNKFPPADCHQAMGDLSRWVGDRLHSVVGFSDKVRAANRSARRQDDAACGCAAGRSSCQSTACGCGVPQTQAPTQRPAGMAAPHAALCTQHCQPRNPAEPQPTSTCASPSATATAATVSCPAHLLAHLLPPTHAAGRGVYPGNRPQGTVAGTAAGHAGQQRHHEQDAGSRAVCQ